MNERFWCGLCQKYHNVDEYVFCWRRRLWYMMPECVKNIYRRNNWKFPFGGEW